MSLLVREGVVFAVPQGIVQDVMEVSRAVRTLRMGCTAGEIKGKDMVVAAELALSIALNEDAFEMVEVDQQTALKFLHRDTIILQNAPKGYIILTFNGLRLGFVKNIGNRCNNLWPHAWRIRIDINF